MKYAIVNTKSNYRNLNGKRLTVVEDYINFITCQFIDEGKLMEADFGRSEIAKIWEPVNLNKFIGRT
jgi:hypothetical protein